MIGKYMFSLVISKIPFQNSWLKNFPVIKFLKTLSKGWCGDNVTESIWPAVMSSKWNWRWGRGGVWSYVVCCVVMFEVVWCAVWWCLKLCGGFWSCVVCCVLMFEYLHCDPAGILSAQLSSSNQTWSHFWRSWDGNSYKITTTREEAV